MTINNLDEKIKTFLDKYLNLYNGLERLAGDASSRVYYRVKTCDRSYILCYDRGLINSKVEDYPFCIVANLLKDNSIPVPEIYHIDSANGFLLLEDLGDNLLENFLNDLSEDRVFNIYKMILDDLIGFQSIKDKKATDGVPFNLAFNRDKLYYEFDFFIENYLINFSEVNISTESVALLKKEFHKIATLLDKPSHFVLNHRDFHCRNILIKEEGDRPFYIDFQDARMGLPQYDLVSLLRDCYYRLSDNNFLKLKDYYYNSGKSAAVHNFSYDEFNYYFNLMAYQRNIKAMGSFGYLCSVKDDKRYERWIGPAIDYLKKYVDETPELSTSYDILNDMGVLNR